MSGIVEYLDIIIGGVAVFGILVKGINIYRKKISEVAEVHKMVHTIFAEVSPNTGFSIKDQICEIKKDISIQNELIDKITRRQFWLLDNESRLIFEVDSDGQFLWANKKFKDLVQRDLIFLKGNGWKNCIHDDDRDEVVEKYKSCIADGITFEDIFRICNATRNVFSVKCTISKADKSGYMGTLILLDNNEFFN
jgi:PAS domain-containing protein